MLCGVVQGKRAGEELDEREEWGHSPICCFFEYIIKKRLAQSYFCEWCVYRLRGGALVAAHGAQCAHWIHDWPPYACEATVCTMAPAMHDARATPATDVENKRFLWTDSSARMIPAYTRTVVDANARPTMATSSNDFQRFILCV